MDINQAVRAVCLSFPEAEEFLSHGSPNFRVRGKTFATYVVNHHGDGRVALWINAPPGAQASYAEAQPKYFFVPPYVGPRGWVGINLDKGLAWKRIAQIVREAYEKVAPPALCAAIGATNAPKSVQAKLPPEEVDPMRTRHARAVLAGMRAICIAMPEVSEGLQFGFPVWRCGKRVFAAANHSGGRLNLLFWVGVEIQAMMTSDPRFEIPAFMGHNGWITLDAMKNCDWQEIESLAQQSYRHFALKRMLQKLDSPTDGYERRAQLQ